jgi:YVTN family beta-propeller protein
MLFGAGAAPVYLSPVALKATPDGRQLFVACATAKKVLVFDPATQSVTRSIPMPESPSGLALSPVAQELFVTCAAPESLVCVVDLASMKVTRKIRTGHTALAPICSPDGAALYVCCRFNNCVAFINLKTQEEICRLSVPREPVSAVLSRNGHFLFVANHLPAGRADQDEVAASISVIDVGAQKVVKDIPLPNGSTIVRDLCLSPDGATACVAHVRGQFHLPTTQTERGWIENNALSFIDVRHQTLLNTVLLDSLQSGAANPWAVAWVAESKTLCVTHAGTHELSVIDAPALLRKLASAAGGGPGTPGPAQDDRFTGGAAPHPAESNVLNDLTFLAGLRQRIALGQYGPRSLAVIGHKAYIGNYFSDSLSVVDLSAPAPVSQTIALGPSEPLTAARRGELAFNDASLCFQGWQSCASCHSSDARVDGLNWDLLNDGMGNPKNVKSLLLAYETPPSMSLGVRADARAAVRAGFRNILFTVPPEATAAAVDAYLEALTPIPSPALEQGRLSAAAARGRKLFLDPKIGCAVCHPPGRYTDLRAYDVGTAGRFDKAGDRFFTPTLTEVWRTAPYLHDGSAATMRDVLTTANKQDRHGKTSQLTEEQLGDLAAFVMSL